MLMAERPRSSKPVRHGTKPATTDTGGPGRALERNTAVQGERRDDDASGSTPDEGEGVSPDSSHRQRRQPS
jgi:hypothetical protein